MLSLGHQMFQLLGAMLILVAYVAHQFKLMNPDKALYNVMNGLGSAILGFYAIWPRFQAGFVVLEVAWVAVSIFALVRSNRRKHASV
ncbi:MAG TPA: hypothetical protein VEG32_03225 [Clostridia bacterium]|nr:hypothetical protein [Clostridia bacterium]